MDSRSIRLQLGGEQQLKWNWFLKKQNYCLSIKFLKLLIICILTSIRSGEIRNLDLELGRVPPFPKGVKGILGSKSVLNSLRVTKRIYLLLIASLPSSPHKNSDLG
jgi:hypothetical protein